MTDSGLSPHYRHNLKRKNKLSLIYRAYIYFPCQESGGNFHFYRITVLFWFRVCVVIKFCELSRIVCIIVSTDLCFKKQTSKDFVWLLLIEMYIS